MIVGVRKSGRCLRLSVEARLAAGMRQLDTEGSAAFVHKSADAPDSLDLRVLP